MNVIGLDQKTYSWKLYPQKNKRQCSSFHIKARIVLTNLFPLCTIHEELLLPGSGGLYLDFYLPLLRLAIEVQGEQHYKFNNLFYKNQLEFFQAKRRDRDKVRWCELNNITLVELAYNESESQWQTKLKKNVLTTI